MERTNTHFEQVPLETVQLILEAEKERLLKSEALQASSDEEESQPRIERKG